MAFRIDDRLLTEIAARRAQVSEEFAALTTEALAAVRNDMRQYIVDCADDEVDLTGASDDVLNEIILRFYKSADLFANAGRGTELIAPEDTPDGDYGRILERAYNKSVKVLASPGNRTKVESTFSGIAA